MKQHSLYRQNLLNNAKTALRYNLCLIAVIVLAGCATTARTPLAPVPAPVTVPAVTEPAEVAEPIIPTEPVSIEDIEPRGDRLYDLLQKAAVETHSLRVRALLDTASFILRERFVSEPETAKKWAALIRFTLERYHAISSHVPIPPQAPLATLLNALPESVVADLLHHPHYRELKIRVLAGQADVPIDLRPEVMAYIQYFLTEKRDFFERSLSRSTAYLPMIQTIFREQGLPSDLAYKAMIESGFNPRALSRAYALGMWQFMYRTGLLYGLRRNTYIDDRMNPEKSTHAAARHLNHLYDYFGDWRLVVAAYNCGQGRMDRAIARSRTRDFWEIDVLPRETRNHVPKFMAAVVIAKDPAFFGFKDVVYQPPLSYDKVVLTEPVNLHLAAECAGTTYTWLKQLNPELRRPYTPPAMRRNAYNLRVPKGAGAKFRANYAQIPAHKKIQLIDYVVKRGDTLSGIASRVGVSASDLQAANGITNPRRLQIGQKLSIPMYPHAQRLAAATQARPAIQTKSISHKPDPKHYRQINVTVRTGDTLWDIAKRTGITVSHLRAWNNLNTNRPIHPGDRLTLWVPKDGTSESPIFYTVRTGDTLWGIARAFDTSVAALQSWNNIRSPSRLRPGTRIRVREIAD
ncbi:MAG: LysM peptidoglycan-binding domain-containing protein [Gemmatimonadota bacterium]|nr:LysM peptidoglycan-binding domain-containing protein [Gemmatimonadota bacterium]